MYLRYRHFYVMRKGSDHAIAACNWIRWRSKCHLVSGMRLVEQTSLRYLGEARGFSFLRKDDANEGTRRALGSTSEQTVWIVPEAGSVVNGQFDWEVYSPLANLALHRIFAKCREVEDVLTFFNEYGPLGVLTCALLKEGAPSGTPATMGEPLDVWVFERARMEYLVSLWDALRLGEESKLRKLIEISGTSVVVSQTNPVGWQYKDIRSAWSNFLPIPGESEIRQAAGCLLQQMLHLELAEHSVPNFTLRKGAQIRIQPQTLFGALHVQLLREVIGSVQNVVLCPCCGEYFPQEHGRMKYCSQACRQRAYMTRKSGEERTNG